MAHATSGDNSSGSRKERKRYNTAQQQHASTQGGGGFKQTKGKEKRVVAGLTSLGEKLGALGSLLAVASNVTSDPEGGRKWLRIVS